MKKFGILALLLAVFGTAVGCEPAKKKVEPPKEPAAVTPAETPAAEAPKTEEAPAEAAK